MPAVFWSCDQASTALLVGSVPRRCHRPRPPGSRVWRRSRPVRAQRAGRTETYRRTGQTFPDKIVHHAQHSETAAVRQRVGDEVQRPAPGSVPPVGRSAPVCPAPACGRLGDAPAAVTRHTAAAASCGSALAPHASEAGQAGDGRTAGVRPPMRADRSAAAPHRRVGPGSARMSGPHRGSHTRAAR